MRRLRFFLIVSVVCMLQGQDSVRKNTNPGPVILPIILESVDDDWEPGENYYLNVEYRAAPNGMVLAVEPAEKVWWFDQIPVLFLGSTGDYFPLNVARRATAWIRISDGEHLVGVLEIAPRKDRIRLHAKSDLADALKKRMAGINASYLAQVVNYLVSNLSSLDVMGSTYSVDGAGTVINELGQWVGVPTGPVGAIVAFGGTEVPEGWLLCDGAVVLRADYPDLFVVIGTAYGEGDGATTFHLPDLRGRFPRGVDGGGGRDPDAANRVASNSGGNVGDAIGSAQDDSVQGHRHNHSDPGHSHGITDPGHSHNYYGWIFIGPYAAGAGANFANGETGPSVTGISINANSANVQILDPITDGQNGTIRTSSETRPQNLSVNFIIKH